MDIRMPLLFAYLNNPLHRATGLSYRIMLREYTVAVPERRQTSPCGYFCIIGEEL